MTGIETISAHDLDRYHGDRNVMIIDLRDREEYEVNVNYDGNEFYKRTEITSRNFDRQYFFPIPQSEIDIDKNLVQNEGF